MKIITLIPVKNEAWILPFTLKNVALFSDEIIILDDNSTDLSKEIAERFPKVTVLPFTQKESVVDMSRRRNLLLQAGRDAQGTHFVWLDADEVFSTEFATRLRETITGMGPGEVLLLPWILVGNQQGAFVYNKQQETNYKDFIFCDDGNSTYKQRFLSEPRTPGDHNRRSIVSFEKGCVYHFQNIATKRNQYKQAWYRINELLKGDRSARKINATYNYTKDLVIKNPTTITDPFIVENKALIQSDAGYEFYIERIKMLFEEKGVLFFEPLDIWYLNELRDMFTHTTSREPRPTVFPAWILALNDIKNTLRNTFG